MRCANAAKSLIEEKDCKNRDELFKRSLALTASTAARKQQRANRNAESLRNKAEKTTEMLNSLVLKMSEQVFFIFFYFL